MEDWKTPGLTPTLPPTCRFQRYLFTYDMFVSAVKLDILHGDQWRSALFCLFSQGAPTFLCFCGRTRWNNPLTSLFYFHFNSVLKCRRKTYQRKWTSPFQELQKETGGTKGLLFQAHWRYKPKKKTKKSYHSAAQRPAEVTMTLRECWRVLNLSTKPVVCSKAAAFACVRAYVRARVREREHGGAGNSRRVKE